MTLAPPRLPSTPAQGWSERPPIEIKASVLLCSQEDEARDAVGGNITLEEKVNFQPLVYPPSVTTTTTTTTATTTIITTARTTMDLGLLSLLATTVTIW